MGNREKLKDLLLDVFLLAPGEFRFDLKREEIETWDSLGTVSLAVGLREAFGHHLSPEEATSLQSVPDILRVLESKGVSFAA